MQLTNTLLDIAIIFAELQHKGIVEAMSDFDLWLHAWDHIIKKPAFRTP